MFQSKCTVKLRRNSQHGIVLLVALVMTIMFVLIGVMLTGRTKSETELVGAKVRYDVVFEAAEQSMRDSMLFIQSIRGGEPVAGVLDSSDNFMDHRSIAEDFKLVKIESRGMDMVLDPSTSFIWKEGELEKKVCLAASCTAGVNFVNYIDSDIWEDFAIKSKLADKAADQNVEQVDSNSYILNTQTYTFIQRIKSPTLDGGGGVTGDPDGLSKSGSFYLITVKASGYTPGVEPTSSNARENVILQAVFVQKT